MRSPLAEQVVPRSIKELLVDPEYLSLKDGRHRRRPRRVRLVRRS